MAALVRSELPPASTLPRGAVVLSLSGTERTELTTGAILWATVLVSSGFALGVWFGRRKKR
jgi:hypothetical protein